MSTNYRSCILAIFMLMTGGAAFAQNSGNSLEQLKREFQEPPNSAQPRTWWHWTNGNLTRDGINKDLEWMNRIGIGGFQITDLSAGTGQTLPKEERVPFMNSEWLDHINFVASKARELGMEMTLFSSPGWSLAGDRSLDPEMRILSSGVPRFGAPRTLQESGLLGPVTIKIISRQSNE